MTQVSLEPLPVRTKVMVEILIKVFGWKVHARLIMQWLQPICKRSVSPNKIMLGWEILI